MEETHRRPNPNSTGDIFTFPPISPNSESHPSQLADQLFSNGTFLLHNFPNPPPTSTIPKSLILSRTSSKSSLQSSRSNSTNSRTSNSSFSTTSCSSGRSSTSESSSRKINLTTINRPRSVDVKSGNKFVAKECQSRNYGNGYGNSQRWQFISPVPVLSRRNSRRRKGRKGKKERGKGKGVCRRVFGWLVSTCQECHAIEPSKRLKVSV